MQTPSQPIPPSYVLGQVVSTAEEVYKQIISTPSADVTPELGERFNTLQENSTQLAEVRQAVLDDTKGLVDIHSKPFAYGMAWAMHLARQEAGETTDESDPLLRLANRLTVDIGRLSTQD